MADGIAVLLARNRIRIRLTTDRMVQVLLIPSGLDLHIEAGFQFCNFSSSPNPSGVFRDFIVYYLATCPMY